MTGEMPPGGWDRPIPAQPTSRAPLASWGSRAGAALVDLVIMGIPVVLLTFGIFGGIAAAFDRSDGLGIFSVLLGLFTYLLLLLAVAILYAPLLMRREGAHNGQTWGKQLLGIRVIGGGGAPIGFGMAALREVGIKGLGLGFLSMIIPFIPYLLDVLWPLWDDENRALHDMVVNTRVVQA
jgi:uncharacterized RDD family membrane protein YckC